MLNQKAYYRRHPWHFRRWWMASKFWLIRHGHFWPLRESECFRKIQNVFQWMNYSYVEPWTRPKASRQISRPNVTEAVTILEASYAYGSRETWRYFLNLCFWFHWWDFAKGVADRQTNLVHDIFSAKILGGPVMCANIGNQTQISTPGAFHDQRFRRFSHRRDTGQDWWKSPSFL